MLFIVNNLNEGGVQAGARCYTWVSLTCPQIKINLCNGATFSLQKSEILVILELLNFRVIKKRISVTLQKRLLDTLGVFETQAKQDVYSGALRIKKGQFSEVCVLF
jgi:hypothetical protein